MTTLRAGAASADITPSNDVMLDGYGSRTSPSTGVHDPIMARAIVLDYGDDGAAAIVVCDLLGMHPWIAAEVRHRACESHGIPEAAIIVAATHDHAAPAGLRTGMFSRLDEPLAESVVANILSAITAAWKNRHDATLKVGSIPVPTLPVNRRDPSGPTDPLLRVLLLDADDGPIATLMSYACHATVLTGANLQITAEFPGVACRIVEQATGAGAVYLQGACGNVNPAWMSQDFASVERAGQLVAGAALQVIANLRATPRGLRSHNIRWDEFPGLAVPGRAVEPRLKFARQEIELTYRNFADDEDYTAQIAAARADAERLPETSEGQRVAKAAISRFEGERWAAAWHRRSGEGETRRTEIQALSLGEELEVIALPGEFFVETAGLIREAAGIGDLLIAGYANDYIGYVVPVQAFEEGGYETGVTFFGGEAEDIIRRAAIDLLRGVASG
jgi:hypothetical protein